LTIYRLVFFRKTWPGSSLRPVLSLIWGAAGGAISGAIATLLIVGVYEIKSLVTMGWLCGPVKQFSSQFWGDLFIRTRFGWAYIILGCGLGVAMAITHNGMRAFGKVERNTTGSSVSGAREFRAIIVQMVKLALPYTWAYFVCMPIVGTILMMILRPPSETKSFQALLLATSCDCCALSTGGFFAIVGVGVGVVLMMRGVHVEPRKDDL